MDEMNLPVATNLKLCDTAHPQVKLILKALTYKVFYL